MYKVLVLLALSAAIILIIVTLCLICFNWSPKLYSPLLSLILIGTISTFITIFVTLKSEKFEKKFSTIVVINSTTHLPPIVFDSTTKLSARICEYNALLVPEVEFNEKRHKIFDIPTSNEEGNFYEELLQFAIYKEIIRLHQRTESISYSISGISSELYTPFKLSEIDGRPLKEFSSELSKNRFFANPFEKWDVEISKSYLPKGTQIKFEKNQKSPATKRRHLLILEKQNYFTITFTIEESFSTSAGKSSIPAGIQLDLKDGNLCKTAIFTIEMKAEFEKLTAGNWRTEELKNWAKWLFERMEGKYSDSRDLENYPK